ncbi:MAG: NADH-quinone oxidoreductase subunit NuoG [Geothermobacteraceae bacterium]
MPTLTIDNQTVTVPEGTNVLEAAKQLGIVIPHFCYHEALGAVGSCRLCAMKFEDGPVKGIQMACMVKAQDGMVVSTVDADAAELRASVIEWLMLNHPHDCPVCDEGGECQLQDMTIAGGHGIRRYRGTKRTWHNQDLGPFIEQEMNRCIQCYRCVRTYQDYFGGTDFGVMGSRNRLFFGRFKDGPLESPFAGNLADVCPTGVFTDKTYRFKSRIWDLQEAPSVCPHCSLGCRVIPGGRYRELQRVRSGVNRQTNGFFICDRGRFGYGHVNLKERPREPKLQGAVTSWSEALAMARSRLLDIAQKYGGESIALLGSPRSSLETLAKLRELGQSLGGSPLCTEAMPGRDRAARALSAIGTDRLVSMAQLAQADRILILGCDPINEAPMLAAAVRQAQRNGAHITVIDPRPVKLPCDFDKMTASPDELVAKLNQLRGEEETAMSSLRAELLQARKPVLVGGADLLGEAGIHLLGQLAGELDCGLCVPLAQVNSFGAALIAGDGPDAEQLCQMMFSGQIRALVCVETDPLRDGPDKMARALGRLECLVVLDCLPNQAARQADVLLPTTAPYESAGVMVNFEGRMQAFGSVIEPGLPIRETGQGNHPPRTFEATTPGGAPRPAWAVLGQLQNHQQSLVRIRQNLEGRDSRFTGLSLLDADGEGTFVRGGGKVATGTSGDFPECVPEGTLPLLVVETLYGSELLSSLSQSLQAVQPEPAVWMHPDTAARLNLEEGDIVQLKTDLEPFSLPLHLEPDMARDMLLAYRLRGTPLELFAPGKPAACLVNRGGDHA